MKSIRLLTFLAMFLPGVQTGAFAEEPQPPAENPEEFFEKEEMLQLKAQSQALIEQVRREGDMDEVAKGMMENYYQVSSNFIRQCTEDYMDHLDACFSFLNDTWWAFYPINASTGRLRNHRGDFPLVIAELERIQVTLNWITYDRPQ